MINELRFIEKDSKKILQYMNPLGQWTDVPLIKE